MAGDRERCLEAGCDHYISKPINRQTLLEIVRRYSACDNTPVGENQSRADAETEGTAGKQHEDQLGTD